MGKTKETGRLTKQNAVSFKREVLGLLAAQQSQIDQLKAKSVDDVKEITGLKSRVAELANAIHQAQPPEAQPDGNQTITAEVSNTDTPIGGGQ